MTNVFFPEDKVDANDLYFVCYMPITNLRLTSQEAIMLEGSKNPCKTPRFDHRKLPPYPPKNNCSNCSNCSTENVMR